MATYVGSLRKNDLEGGFWELVTDGGDVYRLQGTVDDASQKADRVRVKGEIESGGFGIHMSGPAIKVAAIEPA